MFTQNAFNPEQVELMKAAFDAAWKFVEADAALAAVSAADRRISLAQALMALISQGERDAVQLANEAIGLVRRVHMPSPRVRIGHKRASAADSASPAPVPPAPDPSPRHSPAAVRARPGTPRYHRSHHH
jgi:hypothetical protein